MGSSTALVGMLPNYASIGVAAPILLICLRLLQLLKVDPQAANLLIAGSLILGTPFFVGQDRSQACGVVWLRHCGANVLSNFQSAHGIRQSSGV